MVRFQPAFDYDPAKRRRLPLLAHFKGPRLRLWWQPTALGAAIPVEVLCDLPGIGQLAWLAALGRDLPLLVNLTALATAATLMATSVSDFATWRLAGANTDSELEGASI